jgi:hypothetical protein
MPHAVIASDSEAIQSYSMALDCFVACAVLRERLALVARNGVGASHD